LTKEELDKIQDLYRIIRPFRMEKIYPTISLAKNDGNFGEVNRRLQWIYSEIHKDFILPAL